MKREKGITLLAIVITIVILIILGVITVNFLFGQNGLIDRAKQSKFYTIISSLEENAQIKGTDVYLAGKTIYEAIPNYGAVTEEEKDTIVKEIPTLNESVYKATGETVYDRTLYWLNKEEILKDNKKYIIDMDTLQVYDYVGEVFLGKKWHTLNIGISIDDEDGTGSGEEGEIPNGYMKIHLDYPEDSTDRQWRIGRPGEERTDGDLIWQDYTGPILVKIDDIKNIWIRYNLKGVEVVEAPKGTLAVDIRVNPTGPYQEKVTVDVYFEEGSTNQKIKVGNGGWRLYEGPFEVTENCTIQAMAEKEVNVTDQNGNIIGTTTLKGKDSYKITNIGEKEINETLPAPTIEDVGNKGGTEKTTARVTYPEDQGNIRKVYKLNSGLEQEYTGDIKIEEWGTEVIAYYYTEAGEKSPEARKTFNDPTKLTVEIFAQPNPQLDESIKETTVEIEYSEEAESKTYKIDNGQEQEYTGQFTITNDCTITAYAKKTGIDTAVDILQVKFKQKQDEDKEKLTAPKFKQQDNSQKTLTTVTITYDGKSTLKQYSVNGGDLQEYVAPIENLKDGDIVYAYCEDSEKNSADATYNVKIEKDKLSAPTFTQKDNEDKTSATVTINFDKNATIKQYKVNDGELQNYIEPIANLLDGDIVYAYCEDNFEQTADATYTVKINKEEEPEEKLQAPRFKQTNNEDNTQATVTITYDEKSTIKQYNINGEKLQNYSAPIEGLKNGDVIYAYCEDEEGKTADATYTVNLQKTPIKVPTFSQENNEERTAATVTITYDENAIIKQYSINGNELQNYTDPIENLVNGDIVYATNTDAQGESADATYTVKIEKEEFKAPVISPSYLEENSKAKISIKFDDKAVTKKYSINNGELKDYTGPFEVTENGTIIYAINANSEGEEKDATYTVEGITKKLDVQITVNPDTTEEVEKVTVTIDYDEEATEKLYSINGKASQSYTGPFEVTENCTIVAEAKAEDAYGKDTKQITNFPKGLAAPVIKMTKTTETEGEVANITIEYDKRSISNTYSINSEAMQNYTSGFQVRENGTVINAYSVDSAGNTVTSQYVVNDLIRYLLIDKEKYYWILLPYPENSINRQYKYKEDGVWKAYKEDGFILVKSEYEDELIQGGKPIKLEVEPGRYVDFDGHWYIFDGDPQKLQEDIYMKWDDPEDGSTPKVPLQILAMPAPPEKTDKVDIFIIYPQTATLKQYKIDDGAYQDYTGKLEITKNNTKITAKTQYSDGSWSEEVSYTVTNVDENVAPEGIIEIGAEPKEWTKDNVTVTITYNPNSSVLKKKYKIGEGEWQYTENNTEALTIENNTTIYAALENAAGESSDSVTYNVENIDKEGPVISSFKTTNVTEDSITVEVQATDEGSGLAETGTYKYYLNGALSTTTETNTYTFEGLSSGISYSLKVEVADKVGNIGNNTINASTEKKTDIGGIVDGDYMTENTQVEDDLTNKVWIPGGFKVASDSGTKVEDGIVIEDKSGNQFVWIPTGTYQTSSGEKINELTRRTFTSSDSTPVSGDDGISNGIYFYYGEGNSNSVAKNQIGAFKTSVNSKGGFYIGRYEQGKENVCKSGVVPYTNITRNSAKNKAETMYSENSYVVSELISSYAWDTALNFICQNNSPNYTLATTTSRSYGNIGTGSKKNTGMYTQDNYSNVHDILGNVSEWTTEYGTNGIYTCIERGGYFGYTSHASKRQVQQTTYSSTYVGFRVQMYTK